MKEKAKLTNREIAELSGSPVSTVNKIFSGATQNPRYATLLSIEEVLKVKEKLPFTYDAVREEPVMVRESPAPFEVRLFGDDSCIVQPDISAICRKDRLTEKGCSGAPDWVLEITSASNSAYDYITKMLMYQKAGVREYWIVDPAEEKITVQLLRRIF